MQITKIHECLRGQAGNLALVEQRLEEMLAINAKNIEAITGAKSVNDLPVYFKNQRVVFDALLQAVGDMKVVNSYTLLETECQIRSDESQETDLEDETDFRKV